MSNITMANMFLIIGFSGQACFFLRFLVQWIYSEKKNKSSIPVVFWYLSLGGSFLVLIYAVYRKDPVFIVGQLTGSFVYIRNLYLIRAEKKRSVA